MEKLLQQIAALYAPENVKAQLAALEKIQRHQRELTAQKRSTLRTIESTMYEVHRQRHHVHHPLVAEPLLAEKI